MQRCALILLLFAALVSSAQHSALNTPLLFKLADKRLKPDTLEILVIADATRLSQQSGLRLIYQQGRICKIRCSADELTNLIDKGLIERAEEPAAGRIPLNDTMLWRNRLNGVKAWTSPLPRAYNGEGVLMGIIDTGIDFTHGDFKDSLGQTRILNIWDQRILNPTLSPQPYLYGQEWSATDINNGLCTHSDFQYYGHGTGVSGIAAGNGKASGKFEGVAPSCDLIVVAIDFNKPGPTVADAVHYLVTKANQLNRPLVINASLGNYYGSHDGSDLESQLINALIANVPGRVMVAAAGNAGHIPFHVRTNLQSGDTLFTWFSNSSNSLEHELYGDLNQVQSLKFRIGANRGNYSDLGASLWRSYNQALNTVLNDTLKHNGQRIGIIQSAASINGAGVYNLYFKITADTLNLLWRIETTGTGQHDAWNFELVSSPLPSPLQYPAIQHYAHPDSLMNMVSGFQCSDEVLTVANYVNVRDFRAINSVTVNSGERAGDLAKESSSGPTRDMRQKPDVAATGNNLSAAMCLAYQNFYLQNAPQIVAEGSMHIQSGGTSAASPVVAGLAALYLQKNPQATNREVMNAIRFCSYQDLYTGSNLPHPRWGFGKLDAKAAMLCNDATVVSLAEEAPDTGKTLVYPNPYSKEVKVRPIHVPCRLIIFSAEGKCLQEHLLLETESELSLPEEPGLYLLQFNGIGGEQYSCKIIKE